MSINVDPSASATIMDQRVTCARPRESSELGPDLAIGVNGRIEAVTRPYQDEDGTPRWTALLPERVLREGANRIDVFAVASTPDGLRLSSTTLVPGS